MKAHDIIISPAQAKALGAWVEDGLYSADVELCVDDSMLVAGQGDAKAAWDRGGEPGSDAYVALAPLDPSS